MTNHSIGRSATTAFVDAGLGLGLSAYVASYTSIPVFGWTFWAGMGLGYIGGELAGMAYDDVFGK